MSRYEDCPEWKTVDLLPLFWCWTVALGDLIERDAFFDRCFALPLPRMTRIVETGIGYMVQEAVFSSERSFPGIPDRIALAAQKGLSEIVRGAK